MTLPAATGGDAVQRVSICGLAKCNPEPPPEGIGADLWGV